MAKGWFGNRYGHRLASKGIKVGEMSEFETLALTDAGNYPYQLHYKVSIPLFSKEEIKKLIEEGDYDDIRERMNEELMNFEGTHHYGSIINKNTGNIELIFVDTIWAKNDSEVVKAGFNFSNMDEFAVYGSDNKNAIYDCLKREEEEY